MTKTILAVLAHPDDESLVWAAHLPCMHNVDTTLIMSAQHAVKRGMYLKST